MKLKPMNRESALANSADTPIDGMAANDNWIKIAPYGTYPGSRPGRMQHFTTTEANTMVAEFRSLRGKTGRLFRGIPVYIGHPDQNPEIYTDARRLGRITDLQARPDGLYGEVNWNDLGEQNQREGYWVYPSPRWDAPAGGREFRPDRLISVGLTNTPRITDSEPVCNSDDSETESDSITPPNIMDRKLLTDKLGLDVTATDEEIMAALDALIADAADEEKAETTAEEKAETTPGKPGETELANAACAKAKGEKDAIACSLTVAEGKIVSMAAELQASREAHANTLLDAAEAKGSITRADRPLWLPRLTGDSRVAEANALAAIRPTLNTTSLDVSSSRMAIADERTRRETIANAVGVIMREKSMTYHEAWNLAKQDPTLKSVWEGMKTEI